MVNIRSAVVAACVAVGTPAAAQSRGDAISPILEHAIPNILGKSLVAVVVDYAPGGASPAHTHPRAVSVGIESGFPRCGERWSLGGRFGYWDAP